MKSNGLETSIHQATRTGKCLKVRRVVSAQGEPRAASASTDRTCAESIPHSATVGNDANPINNMGLTKSEQLAGSGEQQVQLVMDDGKLKIVTVRSPAKGQVSVVDQVSFTFCVSTLRKLGHCEIASSDLQSSQLSTMLEDIFGFGLTKKRESGTNFYHRSFEIGDNYGQLGIGGQRDTVLVHLYGLGALKAKFNWEERLYEFLTNVAVRPKITRLDLACDDYDGSEFSVDWGLSQYHTGGFTWSGAAPNIEQIGNWIKPTGKGRTLAIGSRSSGKYLRIYEKGKKEGCSESPWTRFEVELKSKDRVIPFDALLAPSDYLAGTYPCTESLNSTSERIKTEKKTASYNYDQMIATTKLQFGRHLRFLRNFLDSSDEVLDLVCHDDPHAIPKRLKPILSGINTLPTQLHHIETPKFNIDDVLFIN